MILDQLGGELASSTLDWNKKALKYVEDLAMFMGLATRVVPEEQASKIAATVRNLEEIKQLRDLTDLLVSPSN
jgi:hypothetical protein